MRKFIFLLLLTIPLTALSKDKPAATLFYSPYCKACIKLKEEFLPALKERYKAKVVWKEVDVTKDRKGLALLRSLTEYFKKGRAVVPSLFIGEFFFTGRREIEKGLERAVVISLEKGSRRLPLPRIKLENIFKKISLGTIAASGLIDGINPCAFAVIIFFVSFLAVYGYRKREIICIGLAYTSAVFITYLFLGLGFFNFLYALPQTYLFVKLFYYLTAIFCFFLSALSIYDYLIFRKTGRAEALTLQLPQFLKRKISLVIGTQFREKKGRSIGGLIAMAFSVGFFVSLLEAVCTGQIYLPIVVFILKNTDLKLKALSYLLLYNAAFILPLIVIFAFSFLGFGSKKFNDFLRRKLAKIKIITAFVFLALGTMILLLS